jgi:hypothetical protein
LEGALWFTFLVTATAHFFKLIQRPGVSSAVDALFPFSYLEGQAAPQNSFVSITLADSNPIASVIYAFDWQVLTWNAAGQ